MPASPSRTQAALDFLQEAVYRSRESQAAQAGLGLSAGSCGLGQKAAVELELTSRGRDLCTELWPRGLDEGAWQQVREIMAEWIRLQDGLDRKRNHFLKDFRQQHGFDRTRYSPEQLSRFEAGLERINGEVAERRQRAAESLLQIGS